MVLTIDRQNVSIQHHVGKNQELIVGSYIVSGPAWVARPVGGDDGGDGVLNFLCCLFAQIRLRQMALVLSP